MLNAEEKTKKVNSLAAEVKKNFPAVEKVVVTVEHSTGDGVYDLDLFEAFLSFPEDYKLTEEAFESMNELGSKLNCYIDTVDSCLFNDNKERKEFFSVCF